MQLLQFQKRKQGGKKKKKKKPGEASGSQTSETSEDQRLASGSLEQAVDPEVKRRLQKAEGGEEVSQADTDHDAPSLASEAGSPIPFEVSKLKMIVGHLVALDFTLLPAIIEVRDQIHWRHGIITTKFVFLYCD